MEKKTIAELAKAEGKGFNEADFFHKKHSKYQEKLQKYGLVMDIVPDSQMTEDVTEEVLPGSDSNSESNSEDDDESKEDTSDGTFVFLGVEAFDWYDGEIPLFFSETLDEMKTAEKEYAKICKTLKKRRIVSLLKTNPRHLMVSFDS